MLIFLFLSSSSREQEMWDERRARDRNREVKPSCEVMRESSLEGDLREAESGCRRHARTQVVAVVASGSKGRRSKDSLRMPDVGKGSRDGDHVTDVLIECVVLPTFVYQVLHLLTQLLLLQQHRLPHLTSARDEWRD